jgi:hypothetical protein
MSCGDADRSFRGCKSRVEPEANDIFNANFNFNTHKEHISHKRLKREAECTDGAIGGSAKSAKVRSHYGPSREERIRQEFDQVKAACGHTQVSEGLALPSPWDDDHQPLQYRNCI